MVRAVKMGVEFPSSVEPRAGPAELTKDFSRGATERTRAAAPTDQPDLTAEVERTSSGCADRTNPTGDVQPNEHLISGS